MRSTSPRSSPLWPPYTPVTDGAHPPRSPPVIYSAALPGVRAYSADMPPARGWAAYAYRSRLSVSQPPELTEDARPELADVARLGRRLVRHAVGVARAEESSVRYLLTSQAALRAAEETGADSGAGEAAAPLRVTDAHLNAALDELLDTRNELTRVLLGGRSGRGAEERES